MFSGKGCSEQEQLSLQNENKRRIQFSEIELDNVDNIKNAEKWFSDFRILLPAVLYNNIKMVLHNLNSLKTNYVSSTFGKIRNKLDATQKKWISQGEKDNLEEISKSMSVQKQCEFVPYA